MKKELNPQYASQLLEILEQRFKTFDHRHPNIKWEDVLEKLVSSQQKLWSLNEMEKSGGEPDIIEFIVATDEYMFVDCAMESPIGRRSLCYDRKAWESRKANKPSSSVLEMTERMGVKLLDDTEYRMLQEKGTFDSKTSSWLLTPENIRELGGAIFGDHRFGQVFIYHNGAESYYASRGFRSSLRV